MCMEVKVLFGLSSKKLRLNIPNCGYLNDTNIIKNIHSCLPKMSSFLIQTLSDMAKYSYNIALNVHFFC